MEKNREKILEKFPEKLYQGARIFLAHGAGLHGDGNIAYFRSSFRKNLTARP